MLVKRIVTILPLIMAPAAALAAAHGSVPGTTATCPQGTNHNDGCTGANANASTSISNFYTTVRQRGQSAYAATPAWNIAGAASPIGYPVGYDTTWPSGGGSPKNPKTASIPGCTYHVPAGAAPGYLQCNSASVSSLDIEGYDFSAATNPDGCSELYIPGPFAAGANITIKNNKFASDYGGKCDIVGQDLFATTATGVTVNSVDIESNTFDSGFNVSQLSNIALSQSLASAGNLTLNGSTVTGGTATPVTPRQFVIYSVGNDSGVTWTITGTNATGGAQSESFTGGNKASASSVDVYGTITQIAGSGATASTVTAGFPPAVGSGNTAPALIRPIFIGTDSTVRTNCTGGVGTFIFRYNAIIGAPTASMQGNGTGLSTCRDFNLFDGVSINPGPLHGAADASSPAGQNLNQWTFDTVFMTAYAADLTTSISILSTPSSFAHAQTEQLNNNIVIGNGGTNFLSFLSYRLIDTVNATQNYIDAEGDNKCFSQTNDTTITVGSAQADGAGNTVVTVTAAPGGGGFFAGAYTNKSGAGTIQPYGTINNLTSAPSTGDSSSSARFTATTPGTYIVSGTTGVGVTGTWALLSDPVTTINVPTSGANSNISLLDGSVVTQSGPQWTASPCTYNP